MPNSSASAGSPAQFTLRVTAGAPHEFDQWRAAVSPMFDIGPLSDAARDAFAMETIGYFFPGMAITSTTSSACVFERPRLLVARSGIENILVQVYVEGGYRLSIEGVISTINPGDIVVFDLTRECIIDADPYTNIAFTLQRDILTPMIVAMDRLHGLILRDGEPRNILLKSHMQLLHAEADHIGVAEQSAVVQGTAALLAACLGPSLEAREGTVPPESMTTLQLMRRAIDSRLDDPQLGPGTLAAQFGKSRASIYRLFEPLGGVRAYIQQRRLMHAYQLISNPSHFGQGIGAIVGKLGFKDNAAFSRAFRNLYRMTPSDVRAAAKSGFAISPQGQPSGEASFAMLNRWLLGLDANG